MLDRILIIAKQYGDEHDGISDYLRRLLTVYSEKKISFQIMTSKSVSSRESSYDVVQRKGSWNLFSLASWTKSIQNTGCDLVNLHYVPQVYSIWGLNMGLTFLLALCRVVLKKRVVVNFHEVYEPVNLKKIWRLPVAILSRLQFFLFLAIAHQVIFTTPVHRARVLPFLPFWKRKMHFIPVFSNLSYMPIDESKKMEIKERWGIEPKEVLLGVFSKTLHSELKIDWILETAEKLKARGVAARVLLIGAMRDSNPAKFQRLEALAKKKGLDPIWTGPLSASELSECLQILDFYMFLSPDGVSPRSTTLMAAFQHHAAMITVPSPQMASYPEFQESAHVLHVSSPEDVALGIADALTQKDKTQGLKENAANLYENYFKPEIVADELMSIYEKVSSS